MIDALKPYPRMENAGVEWLGEVPEEWEVRRLKTVAAMPVSSVDYTNVSFPALCR